MADPQYDQVNSIPQEAVDAVLASLGFDNNPATPEPAAPSNGSFMPPESAPQAESATAVAAPPSESAPSWNGSFMPYDIPDMRNDAGGRRMEASLGMVRDLLGAGGPNGPQAGTAGGAYRDDWERRNMAYDSNGQPTGKPRDFADTVVDYNRTGIDTSGMQNGGLPVQRVYSLIGREMAAEPVRNFGDLRSVPGERIRRDANGEPLLDENGRALRYDLPGYNGQQRFGGNLRPDRLENGQPVFYDPTNNLTYGIGKDGNPDRVLPGGLGYQGGASGGAYGLIPTTDRFGRPVFYDEQGNRTFARNGDKVGAPLDPNKPPAPTGPRTPPPPPPSLPPQITKPFGDAPPRAVDQLILDQQWPGGIAPGNRYVYQGNDVVVEMTPNGQFKVTTDSGRTATYSPADYAKWRQAYDAASSKSK